MFTISFTGQRPKDLFGYDDRARYDSLRELLSDVIAEIAHDRSPVRILTGGAQGADQVAFAASLAARDAGVPVAETDVLVPFAGQDARWSSHGLFCKGDYRRMLGSADHVRDCSADLPSGSSAGRLYSWRNQCLVNGADVLVAVLRDGRGHAGRSGTGMTLSMAHRSHVPCVLVYAATGDVMWPAGFGHDVPSSDVVEDDVLPWS